MIKKIMSLSLSIALMANICSNLFTINTYATTIEKELPLTQNWANSIGGSDSDGYYSVKDSNDGGYITVGFTYSTDIEGVTNKGSQSALIVKYDKDGNQVWAKGWGGSSNDEFYSVTPTSDGGYVAVGRTNSTNIEGITNKGNYDAIIVKFDKNGNQLWVRSFGGSNQDYLYSIVEISNGEIIAVGQTNSTIEGLTTNGNIEAIAIQYDSQGNQKWVKSFGGSGDDTFQSITKTKDNGFIISGYSSSNNISGLTNNGYQDAIIAKYDSEFNQEWIKSFGGSNQDYLHYAIETSDSGFIAVGKSNSTNIDGITNKGGFDCLIVKFDESGNKVWSNNWGGSNTSFGDYYVSVVETTDGGFVANGYYFTNGTSWAPIVKYDSEGNVQWEELIKSTYGYSCSFGSVKTNDGFVVVGDASFNIGNIPMKGVKDTLIYRFTLNFEPPKLTYTQTPNTWTNGDVTIDVMAQDGNGVKEIILPDGNVVKADSVSYTVSYNGTYNFIGSDIYDNSATLSVKVTNIDKKQPNGNILHNTEWTNQDVDVTIESFD